MGLTEDIRKSWAGRMEWPHSTHYEGCWTAHGACAIFILLRQLNELESIIESPGPGSSAGSDESESLAAINRDLQLQVHALQQERMQASRNDQLRLSEQTDQHNSGDPMLHAKIDRLARMVESVYRRIDKAP